MPLHPGNSQANIPPSSSIYLFVGIEEAYKIHLSTISLLKNLSPLEGELGIELMKPIGEHCITTQLDGSPILHTRKQEKTKNQRGKKV